MSGRAIRMILAVVVVVVLMTAGLAIAAYATRIPADAASQPLTVVLVPESGRASDASMFPAVAAGSGSASLFHDIVLEQTCVPPIARAAGTLTACWQVSRVNDEDPASDYFRLRLYGALTGATWPNGVRWIVVRTVPLASGAPMELVDWAAPPAGDNGPFDVCGAWQRDASDGTAPGYGATWRVGWRCPFGASGSGSVELDATVRVPEGDPAGWMVYADFGA